MIRLYVPHPLSPSIEVELSQQQIHYLLHVMRIQTGDSVAVFNGENGEWIAEIQEVSKRSCRAVVREQARLQPDEVPLWLLFSPLKPKPQEFLVEKATELGATRFCPILTERSSTSRFNIDKAKNHAIEAAEQSGRLTIPTFGALERLPLCLNHWPEDRLLLVGDETHASPSLLSLSLPPQVGFMVGPEGGWTPEELSLLKSKPFVTTVDLGNSILRAETAAIAGLAIVKQLIIINEKLTISS